MKITVHNHFTRDVDPFYHNPPIPREVQAYGGSTYSDSKDSNKCPTCGSTGFAKSRLGPHRCEFCDGTFGGHPPTDAEVKQERDRVPGAGA